MDFKEYINYEEFETKKIEFKEIVSHKNYEKWLKEIAAFANTDGGKVFFGVDDDENPIGLTREQVKNEILYINDMCDKNYILMLDLIITRLRLKKNYIF